MTQTEMFPETAPPPTPTSPDRALLGAQSVPVSRRPGWVLVGSTRGPEGFHRVRTTIELGSLITVCGVVGRKIDENQAAIVECPACST